MNTQNVWNFYLNNHQIIYRVWFPVCPHSGDSSDFSIGKAFQCAVGIQIKYQVNQKNRFYSDSHSTSGPVAVKAVSNGPKGNWTQKGSVLINTTHGSTPPDQSKPTTRLNLGLQAGLSTDSLSSRNGERFHLILSRSQTGARWAGLGILQGDLETVLFPSQWQW